MIFDFLTLDLISNIKAQKSKVKIKNIKELKRQISEFMEHSKEFEALAEDAKSRVKEITIDKTLERINRMLDVVDDCCGMVYQCASA